MCERALCCRSCALLLWVAGRGPTCKCALRVSVPTHNKGGQLANAFQGAAQFLCTGRLIFYSHLLDRARVFDPLLSQICYRKSPSGT